ncbi:hypothetical protein OE749_11425 [Aestuariibacter sp. AA17]|uniref:Tetratricopeptide repeat protein n=1 Tax=Fluctibacter corallii TaxID=2984329 RepID=A0ABT3A9E7_9ALTE|nr:hypothetical protein [Aestuariibacter sp. AA17]MCV2885303.1 hypothetical protein [Aestuariibacter sp. AA17]
MDSQVQIHKLIEKISVLPSAQGSAETEVLLEQHPNDEGLLLLSASLFADTGENQLAKDRFYRLLDHYPDNELARIQLALLHFSLGEYKQIQYLLAAYLLWQENETTISHIAHTLLAFVRGDIEAMRQHLSHATVAVKDDASLLSGIVSKLNNVLAGIPRSEENAVKETTTDNLQQTLLNKMYK